MEMQSDPNARIKELEDRQAELAQRLNTALLALANDHFSDNLYRKVLEHDVKEHVYGKVLKMVSIGGLFAGLGLTAILYERIESQVKASMTENQGVFLSAGENLTRDNLIMLISQWLPESDSRQWILSEVTGGRVNQFNGAIEDIIRNPAGGEEGRNELRIALTFAAENRLPQLVPVLSETFLRDSPDTDTRILAFKGLLRSMDVEELDTLLQSYARNDSRRNEYLTEKMINELARSQIDPVSVTQFFTATKTRLTEQATMLAVNAFYLRNPETSFLDVRSRYDLAKINSGISRFFNATTRVIEYVINPASVSAVDIPQMSIDINDTGDQLANFGGVEDPDITNLRLYAGYGLLRAGEKGVFAANLATGYGYGSPERVADILGEILSRDLFPQYEKFLTEQLIPIQEHQSLLQGHLNEFIGEYKWETKDKSYRYQPEVISDPTYTQLLDKIKSGEEGTVSLYNFSIPPWEWTQLVAQFPDADAEIPKPQGGRLIGTRDQQYYFNEWMSRTQFEWDERSKVFRSVRPEVVALDALLAGNQGPYLQQMYWNFFDPQVWVQQVVPLFPQALESSELLASGSLTGSEEEQAQLYQWVSNNGPFWDPETERYQAYTAVTEADAIDLLKQGNLAGYLSYMQRAYFDAGSWLSNVYPLFSGVAAEQVFFGATVTGEPYEQDTLWYWVRDNQPEWDGSKYK